MGHNRVHPFEQFSSQLTASNSRDVDKLDWKAFETPHNKRKSVYGVEEDDQLTKMKKIRELSASIGVKRKLREKVLQDPVKLTSGWQGFKYRQKVRYIQFKRGYKAVEEFFILWQKALKSIEGHFGTGIVSYFIFLKWLFLLSMFMTFLLLMFVIIPQQVFKKIPQTTVNSTSTLALSINCSVLYANYLDDNYFKNENHTTLNLVLDYALGTGVVENTLLYIGYYSNAALSTEAIPGLSYSYDMSLAYIVILIINFLVSLITMVRNSAEGFKESSIDTEDNYYQFCNHVFGTYDFGLTDVKNIELKKKSIAFELKNDLFEERDNERRLIMTGSKLCRLYTVRILVNIVVLLVLGGCACAIYYGTTFSAEQANNTTYNTFVSLIFGFLPSFIITALNIIVPLIFEKIVLLEDYRPGYELKITLLRTVFLRLSSLGMLLGTALIAVSCSPQDTCRVGTGSCTKYHCWESFIGSQIYKLVVTDFFVPFVIIFFVEFPRKLIATKCTCKLVGQQEFAIPKNVLDLVYSQALYWIGSFFSPLIPAIGVLKYFLLFYAKKLSLLKNCIPSKKPYRASDSSAFFLVVLLITFMLCCIPVVYSILRIPPSRGCGPFRIYDTMYETITVTVQSWPTVFGTIVNIIFSESVALPLFLILCLVIYYLQIFGSAQRERVNVLKKQLVLEGKDKQFLMKQIPGGMVVPPIKPNSRLGGKSSAGAVKVQFENESKSESSNVGYQPELPTSNVVYEEY